MPNLLGAMGILQFCNVTHMWWQIGEQKIKSHRMQNNAKPVGIVKRHIMHLHVVSTNRPTFFADIQSKYFMVRFPNPAPLNQAKGFSADIHVQICIKYV